MTQTHYDTAAVHTALDKAMEVFRKRADDQGHVGAQCRIGLAAQRALTIAVVEEINRCTISTHIMQAAATIMANFVLTVLDSLPRDGTIPDETSERADCFYDMHTQVLEAMLEGGPRITGGKTLIEASDVGHG